ncbi:hypothetical protein SAMN05444365_104171 [Micromonospora pattaloongensis]|uniref:Uncharacterized protein n=1 Tax=Micromonospora pattaloongensis TaxID=405436 RepID=A0A1H3NVR0_9ACTN|nr:hypothetical protein [Micromonospora pattaloongensis]SDY92585.1 hypothetical protein SAMN05444365_104171 [Micromonospora pattaloongensis]
MRPTAFPGWEAVRQAAATVPPWIGVVVFAVLLAALVGRVLLQAELRSRHRPARRLLDAVIAPLLFVFVVIVLQRFIDLA